MLCLALAMQGPLSCPFRQAPHSPPFVPSLPLLLTFDFALLSYFQKLSVPPSSRLSAFRGVIGPFYNMRSSLLYLPMCDLVLLQKECLFYSPATPSTNSSGRTSHKASSLVENSNVLLQHESIFINSKSYSIGCFLSAHPWIMNDCPEQLSSCLCVPVCGQTASLHFYLHWSKVFLSPRENLAGTDVCLQVCSW